MHTKIEKSVNDLKSRINHLSDSLVAPSIIQEHHKSAKEYLKWSKKNPFKFTGTYESQDFSADFTYVTALNISPKQYKDNKEPLPVFIYHYDPTNKDPYCSEIVHFYLCFGSSVHTSMAKILITASKSGEYPEHSALGYVNICSINNLDAKQHRVGTTLIQLAIEQSLRLGFKGRVRLNSLQDDFYIKLGFVASEPHVTNTPMHLPQQAIDVWIKKLIQHPIILSAKEIQKHCGYKPIIYAPLMEKPPRLTFFHSTALFMLEKSHAEQARKSYTGLKLGCLLSIPAVLLLILLSMLSANNSLKQGYKI